MNHDQDHDLGDDDDTPPGAPPRPASPVRPNLPSSLELQDVLAELDAATLELDKLAEEAAAASRLETEAVNRVNKLQKEADTLFNALKDRSHRRSSWNQTSQRNRRQEV